MRVLNTDLKIAYYNDPEDGMAGYYMDLPTPTLFINTAYSFQTQARTKIHEYFHALYRMIQDPDKGRISEEEAVRLFEVGVVDLCEQNWKELEALR